MRNIFVIARKELLSLTRQRNQLLIMFASPIVLVSIMGMAFSGLGSSGGVDFAEIRVAVVNQDRGFTMSQRLPAGATTPSLADMEITIDGQRINVGEQLQQNENVEPDAGVFTSGDFSMNFGDQLTAILLSQPLTFTQSLTMSGVLSGENGFDLESIICPLFPVEDQEETLFSGSLDDLFDAVEVEDERMAREGVARGDYDAAVIIAPHFSDSLAPDFRLGATPANTATSTITATAAIEVIANNATPILGNIVRSVVEAIVAQYERMSVAMSALMMAMIESVTSEGDSLALSMLNANVITATLQNVDESVLEPLGCLILPGTGNIQVEQQPLNAVQERSLFSILMVLIGGAQAIFFALFTGVFGINSIYEDRRQGTLQRVLASPTPSSHVLWGRLLGNLLTVGGQLLVLLMAFTTIASFVEGQWTFIWGTNPLALLLVIVGLSLFTTGMGVLVVGLASSSEQVQLFGPIITLALGALGGTFGQLVPEEFGKFSPTWWGTDALIKLASNEGDLLPNLLVLFGVGLLFAVVGTYFFRRRMGL